MPVHMSDLKIHHEVVVRGSRSEIWRLWTTTEGITEWLVKSSKIELQPYGAYELYFLPDGPIGGRGSETCQVLAWIPEETLVISWNAPPTIPTVRDHAHKAWVVVQLKQISENETLVSVTHYGFLDGVDWEATYAYFLRAWRNVLDHLADHQMKKISG